MKKRIIVLPFAATAITTAKAGLLCLRHLTIQSILLIIN